MLVGELVQFTPALLLRRTAALSPTHRAVQGDISRSPRLTPADLGISTGYWEPAGRLGGSGAFACSAST